MLGSLLGGVITLVSCTAGNDGDDLDGNTLASGQGPGSSGQGGSTGSFNPSNSGGAGPGICTQPGPDADADGFLVPTDCNDCDPNVNPGAIEVPTDPMDPDAEEADENCDNQIDEAVQPCDTGLFYADTNAFNAAKALEICNQATPGGQDFGAIQAYWVRADGTPAVPASQLGFGIQQNFGPNVLARKGENMLMLSSGHARLPGQQGAATDNGASTTGYTQVQPPPTNFPQQVPGCSGGTDIYDDVGLEMQMRAPTNATGFKYLFKFYSFEFAEYVCTTFNDQYVALVNPPPPGAIFGNISFDSMNNPVSVNIAYFDVCDPIANNDFAAYCFGTCPPMPNPYCPSGPAELMGSGFEDAFGSNIEDAGGTSWLQTTAPIDGGSEFTIRFAVWDVGDNIYDSTVLIDDFQWLATPGTQVITQPPPE